MFNRVHTFNKNTLKCTSSKTHIFLARFYDSLIVACLEKSYTWVYEVHLCNFG